MFDLAGLAVHQVFRAYNLSAKGLADRLVTQTYSEQRHFPGEVANQFDADAGFSRRAGTGRDHNFLWSHGFDFRDGYLVVATNLNLSAQFPDVLDEVVGKRVVVVENEDHGIPILAGESIEPQRSLRS